MKVFVVGASGRVGQELCQALIKRGHQVTAGARHFDSLKGLKLTEVPLDLHAPVAEIADKIGQQDALYFVAGSRGSDVLEIDTYGAIKTMQAAQLNHISRYIMLSGYGSLNPSFWEETTIREYYLGKYLADNWLIHQTDLDYTILQPGSLTETPATGTVALNVQAAGNNSISDVARVLAAIPDHDNLIGKVIPMHEGTIPIDEALAQI
ncbi:NAD(P)H-binding protein [Lactobacillus xylocopicola]|uniref:Oxidoreductase n=1 Tax=Lactobacillus xylocopicola TaxID=2976676 RepID=A0ABM8BIM1_9LACO|nr:NAD(P)H-binding protein [Lactobacillus xylocopicola]BDR61147.1 oxidoreductase [Lactobacillus xylocopicola]